MKEHIQEPGPTVSGNSLTDLKAIQEEHVSCCAHLKEPYDHRHTCIGGHAASERVGGVTFWPCPIIMLLKALAEAEGKLEAEQQKVHLLAEQASWLMEQLPKHIKCLPAYKTVRTKYDAILGGSETMKCPECDQERPDDDRVKAGMKCGSCAYGGGSE